MRVKAYLTIDLDYWNRMAYPFKWIERKFLSIPNRSMVLDHHDVLPSVNKLTCSHLVNVDWHSDIGGYVDGQLPALNCGTWVDWVKWTTPALYHWIHPNDGCPTFGPQSGRCDIANENDLNRDAFKPGESVWNKVVHSTGTNEPELPDYHYVGVNLCLSEDYIYNTKAVEQQVINWFADFGKYNKLLSLADIAFCRRALKEERDFYYHKAS